MNQSVPPTLKPFIKWVGGKTQFLEIISLLSPPTYNRLIEPFVGGGAVFFNQQPNHLIINDINQELIDSYQIIKEEPQKFLKLLSEYEKSHSKEFYEELRKQNVQKLTKLELAARFVYLNKTGFNGLYRVNSQGIFNVPFGQKEKIKLANQENILAISNYLKSSDFQILKKDYQELLPLIQVGDFLFVDPPYDSEKSNGFTEYTANGFNKQDQKKLLNFLKEAEKKGAKWLLTNHATPFIQELYQDYPQFTKKAYRYINCQGDKRVGTAQEIFIWNYQLTEEQKKELEFEKFFDTIQLTNIDLKKLVDWKKIKINSTLYEEDLNTLNSLLSNNKEELEEKIKQLWSKKATCFQLLPLLLAIKDKDFSWLDQKEVNFWKENNLDLAKIKKFITDSDLIDLFTDSQIKDLKDYVLGVEVGLDTHGRKRRGGLLMENGVEKLLIDYQVEYKKQVAFALNGKKQFDFWIKIKDEEYYLEANFFNSPGSKISEIIRAYSHLQQQAQEKNVNFLWIADGKGLKSAKERLKNVFFTNKNFLFTLASFEKWLKELKV